MITISTYGSDKVAFLLVDGHNVLGVTTQFQDTKEALLEQTTPLGVEWEEQSPTGLKRAEFSQEGYYDDATDSVNAALSGKQGVSRSLVYGIEGNTIGKRFTGYEGAMQVNYVRIASRNELHKANAQYQGNGQVDEGVILHALGAETADGNTEASSVDDGAGNAPSTDGGVAYLHVTALDLGGYDDVTIKITDSADNGTFGDLVTFTDVSATATAERKTVAGNVERYLAVEWVFNGTGSDPSITFMVGFSRG